MKSWPLYLFTEDKRFAELFYILFFISIHKKFSFHLIDKL